MGGVLAGGIGIGVRDQRCSKSLGRSERDSTSASSARMAAACVRCRIS